MFSVVIIPYPFIVTLVSRWQYYFSKYVRKPKAINLARWKDGKNCELHRLPPVGKGSGKCRTARLVLEAGSARLRMRLDVKVRTVSESMLVRLLKSESLLVETVASGCVRISIYPCNSPRTSGGTTLGRQARGRRRVREPASAAPSWPPLGQESESRQKNPSQQAAAAHTRW